MATSNATVTKVTVKMRKMEGTTEMKRRTKKKKKPLREDAAVEAKG